jgi:hypothetical protein
VVKPPSNGNDPLPANLLRDDRPTQPLLLLPATLKCFHLPSFPLNSSPDLWWKRGVGRCRRGAVAVFELSAAAAGARLVSPDLTHISIIIAVQSSINLRRHAVAFGQQITERRRVKALSKLSLTAQDEGNPEGSHRNRRYVKPGSSPCELPFHREHAGRHERGRNSSVRIDHRSHIESLRNPLCALVNIVEQDSPYVGREALSRILKEQPLGHGCWHLVGSGIECRLVRHEIDSFARPQGQVSKHLATVRVETLGGRAAVDEVESQTVPVARRRHDLIKIRLRERR